jgi:hypothetical protein
LIVAISEKTRVIGTEEDRHEADAVLHRCGDYFVQDSESHVRVVAADWVSTAADLHAGKFGHLSPLLTTSRRRT